MLKIMLKTATYIYLFTLLKIFNFFGNAVTYTKIICQGKWSETTVKIKDLAKHASSFEDLNNYYKVSFSYQFDGLVKGTSIFSKWPTWEPTIRSFVFRKYSDNCDGAVVEAKFLYKEFFKQATGGIKNFTIKKRVIVPYNSLAQLAYKTHFVLEVINKQEGWSAIYSSGKISLEKIEDFALRYEGTSKYIII